MTYEEKLKLPSWQQRRLQILQRDKWKCTCCNRSDIELQVHHKIYLDLPSPQDYPDDLLVTLCKVCHNKEMQRPVQERMLLTSLKTKGFMLGDLVTLSCKIETDENFTKQLIKILREFNNG